MDSGEPHYGVRQRRQLRGRLWPDAERDLGAGGGRAIGIRRRLAASERRSDLWHATSRSLSRRREHLVHVQQGRPHLLRHQPEVAWKPARSRICPSNRGLSGSHAGRSRAFEMAAEWRFLPKLRSTHRVARRSSSSSRWARREHVRPALRRPSPDRTGSHPGFGGGYWELKRSTRERTTCFTASTAPGRIL